MNQFLQTLQKSGYRQFYLAFGDANLRYPDWVTGAKGLSGPLLDLVKLFLLKEPLPRKRAVALLGGELVSELVQCGVVGEQPGGLISNSFVLIFCRSHAMFCQITSDPFAYYGEDSLALATYQTPAPGGRVLDLCCGPGIQSFVAAGSGAQVTGVEIRKETWRIAQLNHRLNQAGKRVKFVCASAGDFAKSNQETFDRILFNPPLVPMVPGYKFAFVGNGGGDGLEVTRDILELYHRRIADGGAIEFIGTAVGPKRRPACGQVVALARRYSLGGRVHVFSQHPIRPFSPLFESLVLVLVRDNGLDATKARKILSDHFAGLGADTFWLFFASLSRGLKGINTVDISNSFWGHWFV